MRVELKLDEAELKHFQEIVEERGRRGTNMRPALEAVADDFLDLEESVFATQGRLVLAAGWKKLSPKWLKFKTSHGLSPRILEMTQGGGRLRRSLTVHGAPWQLRDVTNDEVVVGTTLGIANVHQKGRTVRIGNRTVKIPARKFVRLRRTDKQRWIDLQQSYLSTGTVTGRLGLTSRNSLGL